MPRPWRWSSRRVRFQFTLKRVLCVRYMRVVCEARSLRGKGCTFTVRYGVTLAVGGAAEISELS